MPLKAVLDEDQFGELDESTKSLYAQNEDGQYVVDLENADALPQVRQLSQKRRTVEEHRLNAERERDNLKARLGPLADIEDLNLSDVERERVERLLPYLSGEAELPELDDKKSKQNNSGQAPDLDKIRRNARLPVERERDEVVAERDALKSRLENLVTDSALTAAVSELKVAGPYVKAVKAMFRDRVKVVEGEDGEPVAMIEGEYGEQPVAKYLKEWGQTDEGKAFIEADRNNGGGTRMNGSGGGKVKNPWSPENWSMAEQGRIYREQGKEVAQRMAAEYGKKVQ